MGIFDFFKGGNSLVAAKSTVKIFSEGVSLFGSYDRAYRYTYIFRNNTITKYAKYQRDFLVSKMFQDAAIVNCTYITIANLNTGAAPEQIQFYETYLDFNEEIVRYLRKYGIPEQYVSGDNKECIAHIAHFLRQQPVVPPEMLDALIYNK